MKNSMENENIEPKINDAEKAPATLTDFVQKLEERQKEALENPSLKEHFTSHGANRHVRPGNVPDVLRAELQIKTRAAKHLLLESTEEMHGSREELRRQEALAKLVEYYELKEEFLARYAEAKDDQQLEELASVMEQDMPFLKEMYETYSKQVKENT
jgi:hypothetical protein